MVSPIFIKDAAQNTFLEIVRLSDEILLFDVIFDFLLLHLDF